MRIIVNYINYQFKLNKILFIGHLALISAVLVTCASIKQKQPPSKDEIIFLNAAKDGNLAVIKDLLSKNINVNVKDQDKGYTALMYAVVNNHFNVFKELIAAKADVNSQADTGTINMIANQDGTTTVKHNKGRSAIWLAAYYGRLEMTQELLNAGANVNLRDETLGCPASVIAAKSVGMSNAPLKLFTSIAEKDNDLNNGCDVEGNASLHIAAGTGNVAMADYLLKIGVNPGVTQKGYLNTPLHMAALENRTKVIEMLIKSKAPIDAQAKNGATPLQFATMKGHKEAVNLLLNYKANIAIIGVRGKNALQLAIEYDRKEIQNILVKAGAK